MKFQIEGVDADTGQSRNLIIQSNDEHEAIVQAKSLGVFPTSVRQLDDESETVTPNSTSHFTGRQIFSFLAIGLIVVGVVLGVSDSPMMFWLCAVGVLVGVFVVISIDWNAVAQQVAQQEADRLRDEQERQQNIICPHCHERGHVKTTMVKRKKGISGGKATAALFTVGWSLLATGLSRKEEETEATCSHCGSVWHF